MRKICKGFPKCFHVPKRFKGFPKSFKTFRKGFKRVSKGFQRFSKGFQKCFQTVSKAFSKGFKPSETGFQKGFRVTSNPLKNAFVDKMCFRMDGHICTIELKNACVVPCYLFQYCRTFSAHLAESGQEYNI